MTIRVLRADRRMRALLMERGIVASKRKAAVRVPQAKSEGEETLALSMRADGSIPPFEREHAFWPGRRHAFDFAFVDRKIAVEVDGGHWIGGRHSKGKGFEADAVKLNEAVCLGWRVLRFTTEQVKSGHALHTIKRALS